MAQAAQTLSPDVLLDAKGKAVWLVENTGLTFEQIAAFCGMHLLEIQAIADGDPGSNWRGQSPVAEGDVTSEEIQRCEQEPSASLERIKREGLRALTRSKGPRYTPVSKRADKPDGVSWLLRYHPEFSDTQIAKLIGSTKGTVTSIRDRSHSDIMNIKPRDPVFLGLCKQEELTALVAKYGKKQPEAEVEEQPAYDAGFASGDQPEIGDWEN